MKLEQHRLFMACVAMPVLLAAPGCATVEMGTPIPATEHLLTLRTVRLAPMAVGQFVPAPGLSPATDEAIRIRGALLKPAGGSLAGHLKGVLTVQLKAAGWLDPASRAVVSGELLRSEVDTAMGTATASLGARFTVKRAGTPVYLAEWRVDDQWEGAFLGAVAIPTAMAHYEALYGKLVGKLLDDPAFRRAMAP